MRWQAYLPQRADAVIGPYRVNGHGLTVRSKRRVL